MANYNYQGYVPYGAGEQWLVDQWTDFDPFIVTDANAVEDAIENGCTFEIVDELNAFLHPPRGRVDKIHFVRAGIVPHPLVMQDDGTYLVPVEEAP